MYSDSEKLLKLDISFRAEADEMLAETGLGKMISDPGYEPVGSYVMRTRA